MDSLQEHLSLEIDPASLFGRLECSDDRFIVLLCLLIDKELAECATRTCLSNSSNINKELFDLILYALLIPKNKCVSKKKCVHVKTLDNDNDCTSGLTS
jgi:hypothetical protein